MADHSETQRQAAEAARHLAAVRHEIGEVAVYVEGLIDMAEAVEGTVTFDDAANLVALLRPAHQRLGYMATLCERGLKA